MLSISLNFFKTFQLPIFSINSSTALQNLTGFSTTNICEQSSKYTLAAPQLNPVTLFYKNHP